MKKALHIVKEVISWLLLFAMLVAFGFTVYSNLTNENEGEGAFLLGYRPVLVLTGSMEPHMMTNSIALTKKVTDIEELAVNDVVTYHVVNENGKLIRITHRIIDIDGEHIYTKGDNNQVSDGFPLTIENIEAKVVYVVNATAWIAAKWNGSVAGKVMLISFGLAIIFFYFCIKSFFRWLGEKIKSRKAAPEVPENVIEEPSADNETHQLNKDPEGEGLPVEEPPVEPNN